MLNHYNTKIEKCQHYAKSTVAFMEVILVETKKILSTIGTFVSRFEY